jgi:hypothetical protein
LTWGKSPQENRAASCIQIKIAETGAYEVTLISSLGLSAGAFLLVPKGVVVTALLWGDAKAKQKLANLCPDR